MTEPDVSTPTPQKSAPRGWTTHPLLPLAAVGLSVVALGVSILPQVTGGGFGGRVRAYLLANPQVLDEVVAARQSREDSAIVETVNRIAAANPGLLAVDPADPVFGPADARVTVIEFFDFRCPGCKVVAPDYLALMRRHPEVRFVFKDWPILDREGETTSQLAARAALAAHRQGKYLAVHEALMRERALDAGAIERILIANGVAMPEATAAIQSPEMTRHIANTQTSAAGLRLAGTPTFFVNGRASPSIDPAEIERQITAAKAG